MQSAVALTKEKPEAGRARVRRLLIRRLNDVGLQKRHGMKAEAHLDMLGRLEAKLAYMSEVNLNGLADLVIAKAENERWPKEVTILQFGNRLQLPPPRRVDYAVSVMRSAMGKQALAGGYHVELLDIARRWGPPPSKYEISQLQVRSIENVRKHDQVMARAQKNLASRDDQQWLAWYLGLKEECEAIMSEATGVAS
ncbi:hypothetical protein [Pelagimonas varians]|uniref:Uncharacterized protein n=1 Tax=Pelagimonas varians TaxID=696760 RepID=A0A238KCK8_9RHOB|nr:hypothetical protein [Pelagimonas varians]PYG29980.1 hypothetical protein C8N36_107146 [Pelagimonas varians]SMX40581.1 hypothetical protein PEV8663_02049 [Pelagimonas varians]